MSDGLDRVTLRGEFSARYAFTATLRIAVTLVAAELAATVYAAAIVVARFGLTPGVTLDSTLTLFKFIFNLFYNYHLIVATAAIEGPGLWSVLGTLTAYALAFGTVYVVDQLALNGWMLAPFRHAHGELREVLPADV